jgi:hypothetical protein
MITEPERMIALELARFNAVYNSCALSKHGPSALRNGFKLFEQYRLQLETVAVAFDWSVNLGMLGEDFDQEITRLKEVIECEAIPNAVRAKRGKKIAIAEVFHLKPKQQVVHPIVKAKSLGSIYLATANGHGCTKIGFSTTPAIRESTLQAEDPSFRMVFTSQPVWTLVMEGKLHERYHTKRVRGEWFKLSRKDISAIQKELVV